MSDHETFKLLILFLSVTGELKRRGIKKPQKTKLAQHDYECINN